MMAGFLIDTNVVSELRKGPRADSGVRGWFDEHSTESLWLSVLVVGELRRGVELLRRRDAKAGRSLDRWLQTITADFDDRILPVTTEICERWAVLNVPDPVPVIDGLLAATALVHDLVLVTRNTADIARTGVALENPFTVQ